MKHTSKEILKELLVLYTKTYHIKGAGLHTFIYKGGFDYTEKTKYLLMSFSADKKNKEETLHYFMNAQLEQIAEENCDRTFHRTDNEEKDS